MLAGGFSTAKMADGAIIGTACVRTIGGSETPVEAAKEFAKSFRDALKGLTEI